MDKKMLPNIILSDLISPQGRYLTSGTYKKSHREGWLFNKSNIHTFAQAFMAISKSWLVIICTALVSSLTKSA